MTNKDSQHFIIISDYLLEEIPFGGAEICTDVLKKRLLNRGHSVWNIRSSDVSPRFIRDNLDSVFILVCFTQLSALSLFELRSCRYIIYEHDFQIFPSRIPNDYHNFLAPHQDIRHLDVYRNAYKVIVQSDLQKEIIAKNISRNDLHSCNGNLWYDSAFATLEEIRNYNRAKNGWVAVLEHPYNYKNFRGAVDYCKQNNLPYGIIPRQEYTKFLKELSIYGYLVFLPNIVETLSRVCVEARILNLEIIGNENIAFLKEPWAHLSGEECLNYLKNQQEKIVDLFCEN